MRPGGIRLVLPGPGDGQLNECRRNGGKNEHEQAAAVHTAPAIAGASAEKAGETGGLREQGDRAGERGCDGTGKDVTIPYMPQLVGEHAFQFLVIQQVENTLGDRNGCMLGVAPGSERVRRIAGDDIDFGHGERHARQDALYDLVDPRELLARDRLSAIHR